jgi:uncharacterized membrane protein YtjA (UPF0391 family)
MAWPITFLIIALAAGALGITGISGTALFVAWGLFVLGIGISAGLYVLTRRPPARTG